MKAHTTTHIHTILILLLIIFVIYLLCDIKRERKKPRTKKNHHFDLIKPDFNGGKKNHFKEQKRRACVLRIVSNNFYNFQVL